MTDQTAYPAGTACLTPARYPAVVLAVDGDWRTVRFTRTGFETRFHYRDLLPASACQNPQHDHVSPAHEDTPAGAPLECGDCRRPMHYDVAIDQWVHDDVDAACFLIPTRPIGASQCTNT